MLKNIKKVKCFLWYGAIKHTHTPCLVIANMADMKEVGSALTPLQKVIAGLPYEPPPPTP